MQADETGNLPSGDRSHTRTKLMGRAARQGSLGLLPRARPCLKSLNRGWGDGPPNFMMM
jgi:hypothetical protein